MVRPVPPLVAGKAPDTTPDWFNAKVPHAGMPAESTTKGLYCEPILSLDQVLVAEPYSMSPVATVAVPVPPFVAATVPVKEMTWPVTSIGAVPEYVSAAANWSKGRLVVPTVMAESWLRIQEVPALAVPLLT